MLLLHSIHSDASSDPSSKMGTIDADGAEHITDVECSSSVDFNDSLITIGIADIPHYLHGSEFYRSLDADEKLGTFQIPKAHFKPDDTVESGRDLLQVLNVLLFWGLDEIPFSVLDFCQDNYLNIYKVMWQLPYNCGLYGLLSIYSGKGEGIINALRLGRKDLVRHWIQSHPPGGSEKALEACHDAASVGDVDLLKQLHADGYPIHICFPACSGGHLECLRYMRENGCEWSRSDCSATIYAGHLHCLKYFHESGFPLDDPDYCKTAAMSGHVDCLEFLHETGCPWDTQRTCVHAANHLNCVAYAFEHGCSMHEDLTLTKNVETLWYALQFDCPVHRDAIYNAMRLGYPLDCIQKLRQNGGSWDQDVAMLALNRPSECLIYLLKNGCPYDSEQLVKTAVFGNKVEHLRYLVEDMLLPLHDMAFSAALIRGNLECVQFLLDVGCPSVFVLSYEYFVSPIEERILLCIQYAHEHGWLYNEELVHYVSQYRLFVCRDYLCQYLHSA